MSKTDENLLEEVLAGTLESFDELMRRHQRLVHKVEYGFTREPEQAMDLTQMVFLKVYRNLRRFRKNSNFRTWLMRIAYNEGINWCRARKRRREVAEPERAESWESPAAGQESGMLRSEKKKMIRRGMQRLNERHQLALVLRYDRGLPIKEIAGVLECSEGTVKSILFRSVRTLRDACARMV